LLVILGGWLAAPQSAHAQIIITVDAGALGPTHDGLVWTTAYTTIQDALDLANANRGASYERFVAPIDAGNNLSVTVVTVQDGAPRIQHGTVAMDAYEAAPRPRLALAKQVTPAAGAPYYNFVNYTLIHRNAGNLTDMATVTDALPAQVLFGGWLATPGATQTAGQITWRGTITPATALTYIFTATHTAIWATSPSLVRSSPPPSTRRRSQARSPLPGPICRRASPPADGAAQAGNPP
jgi:hypothetical protein